MTNQSGIRVVTWSALHEISALLDDSDTPGDFLAAADAVVLREGSTLSFPYEAGPADPLSTAPGTARDIPNGPRVYEFVGVRDRANASDPRLWTYLALMTYRDYMDLRWPLTDGPSWRGRAKERWVMSSQTRVGLVRHGIARLWWATYLTHDAHRAYPLSADGDLFAYTRLVFEREDRFTGIFEREIGSMPGLIFPLLQVIADGDRSSNEQWFRDLMKEVTLVLGYRDLEQLNFIEKVDVIRALAT